MLCCGGTTAAGNGGAVPFLELRGWDESGKVSGVTLHSALPPVGILLVDDLNDVTCLKFKAGFFARDEVVFGWVVVKLGPHVHLLHMKTCDLCEALAAMLFCCVE